MSTDALNRAWHSKTGGTTKLVLLALADWADKWGYTFPSMKWIADRANIAERSVYRQLKVLLEKGEIRLLRSGGGSPGMTNIFHVSIGLTDSDIAKSEIESPIAIKALVDASVKSDNCSPRDDILSGVEKSSVNFGNHPPRGVSLSGDNTASTLDRLTYVFKAAAKESSANLSPLSICQGLESENEDERLEAIALGLHEIGWRGPLDDISHAFQEDPERVCKWVWFARKNGWKSKGGLFRTVMRSSGEYPPDSDPDSDPDSVKNRTKYFGGEFSEYVYH